MRVFKNMNHLVLLVASVGFGCVANKHEGSVAEVDSENEPSFEFNTKLSA